MTKRKYKVKRQIKQQGVGAVAPTTMTGRVTGGMDKSSPAFGAISAIGGAAGKFLSGGMQPVPGGGLSKSMDPYIGSTMMANTGLAKSMGLNAGGVTASLPKTPSGTTMITQPQTTLAAGVPRNIITGQGNVSKASADVQAMAGGRGGKFWDQYAGYEGMLKVSASGKGVDTRAADAAIAGRMRQAEAQANPLRTAIVTEGFPKYYGGGGEGGTMVKVGGTSEDIAKAFAGVPGVTTGLGGKYVRPTEDMMRGAGIPEARIRAESIRPMAGFEVSYEKTPEMTGMSKETLGGLGSALLSKKSLAGYAGQQRAKGKVKKQLVKRHPPTVSVKGIDFIGIKGLSIGSKKKRK